MSTCIGLIRLLSETHFVEYQDSRPEQTMITRGKTWPFYLAFVCLNTRGIARILRENLLDIEQTLLALLVN